MNKFEQIIEDQYKRLGIVFENDDMESDNEDQKKELTKAREETDAAEDTAHDAKLTSHKSRQNLAAAEKDHADQTTADSNNKAGKIASKSGS